MHLSKIRPYLSRLLVVAGLLPFTLHAADLKLAGVFTDNAVLQREKPATIWGVATPGETVTAEINGQTRSVTAGPDGRWRLELAPMAASADPVPFKVTSGARSIVLRNVVVGEVWFAAGQSNMTMPVRETLNAAAEIAAARDGNIREFTVAQRLPSAQPRASTDTLGSWTPASPARTGDFSATGYYFARALRERLQVPVGILHASAGGIAAETLTPPDALQSIPSLAYLLDERGEGYGRGVTEAEWNRRKQAQADFWKDMESPATDDSAWESVQTLVTDNKVRAATWFRYRFTADASWAGRAALLRVLRIAGVGRVSLNGKRLAASGPGIDALDYKLAPGDLRTGDNVLAFRINGYALNNVTASACVVLDAADPATALPLPATALRKAESDAVVPPDNLSLLGNLFNGMVAPLIPYQVRGVLWYQGESNVRKAREYRVLFPALITGWRRHWSQPELPFCFVQLAGFMEPPAQPSENSEWAELRDAQASALSLPATAMAVALDLGEARQIHPKNKQEVGRRLSLAALSSFYGYKDVAGSGPAYAGHTVSAEGVRVTFARTAGGLALREGSDLKGFALAGKTGAYAWADARILDERTVLLSSPRIKDPARILYAWSHNSDANLANKAGLPAVPFRAGPP